MLIIPARRPQPLEPDCGVLIPERLPLVSVIVACWGQLSYTQGLVESLKRNAGTQYELILVDNGCLENTADWAERQGIRCIRMGENAGVPRAYNAGVKAATGDIIGVWNNDMVCHPDGLARLARASYARGMAAQSAGMWSIGGDYAGATMDFHWSDYAEGYALVCQREVWEEVGEWDPTFFPSYSDDADFCMRARMKGFDWRLVEGAVEHFGQKSSSHFAGISQKEMMHQAIIRKRYQPLGLGRRVLVQRWGAHGDVLMATPAIRGLKRRWPLARIHLQCQSDAGKVLLGNPMVDAIFERPCPSRRYTDTVNLNNAYEAGQPLGRFEHPCQAFCDAAGVEYDEQPYDLFPPAYLMDWAEKVTGGQRLIACGLRSGTRPKQNWHARGWMELADRLPEGLSLLALDSAPNPPLGHSGHCGEEEAAFYSHPRVVNLTGQTESIMHAAALVGQCLGFVGVDSGLMHVAHAFSLPIVNLCAAAPMKARLPLVGPRVGFEGVAPCMAPGCQAPSACPRTDGPHCLAWVNGEMVSEALKRLLNS